MEVVALVSGDQKIEKLFPGAFVAAIDGKGFANRRDAVRAIGECLSVTRLFREKFGCTIRLFK
jgi:hypothetical protein